MSEIKDPGVYQTHVLPFKQEHEGALLKDTDYAEFFNDKGFVIRAKTDEGADIHLWSFMYQQRGPEVIVDGDLTQSLFMVTNYSDEEKQYMHDNAYINKGQNIEDYGKVGDIKIEESAEEVTWSTPNRKYVCKPPLWHLSGDHAGVTTDITLNEISPGFFHLGSFENLDPKSGCAGYIGHGRVEGSITVKGKTHKFKGFGVHERIIQYGIIPDRTGYMGNRGLNWMHGFSDEFSWYCFKGDVAEGQFTGIVNIAGESFPVENGQGGIEETAYWIDPKSKIVSPYKWQVWMTTPKGRLQATVNGYARGYYSWIRKHGTMVVNQYQADSKSTFTYSDGRVLEAPTQLAMIEHMRTLYRQPES